MRALSICKPFAKPHLLFVIYLHVVCVLEQMAGVLWYCCFRVNGKTERRLMYARTWMHSSILNTCSLRGKVFFYMLFSPRDYHPFFHTLHVSPPASSNLYLSYMYTPHTYRCYRTLATFTVPRCGQDKMFFIFIWYYSMGSLLSSGYWGQCCSVRRGWINFCAQFDRLNWRCLVVQL